MPLISNNNTKKLKGITRNQSCREGFYHGQKKFSPDNPLVRAVAVGE
jgi:hypothetical protein